MTRPQIATILDDGTYGQRDATDEEIAELEANGYGTASDDEPDPPRLQVVQPAMDTPEPPN